MGAELNKIMAMYGISTTTPAPYTGSKSGAQAEADKMVYDQYKKDYENRIANTDMYNQAIFSTNNANVPAFTTLSDAQKNALGFVPPTNGAPSGGQQLYGIDQSGLNNTITNYMATLPTSSDLLAFKQKYGINDWDIRNAMGTGQQRGTQQWSAPLMNPTYIPVNPTVNTQPEVPSAPSVNPTNTPTQNPRYYDEFDDSRLPAYKIGVINRGRYNTQQGIDGSQQYYAKGGSVKPEELQNMIARYGLEDVDYSDAINAAKARKDAEYMAFNDLINKHLSSPQESKAERSFRLASAFGAPTKTGHFSENLSLATSELADLERAKKEKNAQDLSVLLNVQKMKMQAADDELAAQLAAANATDAAQRDVSKYTLKKEIDSLYEKQDPYDKWLSSQSPEVIDKAFQIKSGLAKAAGTGDRQSTALDQRLAALDAVGATPEEKKAFLLGTSKSNRQSTLSQLAEAYGYPEGTPEHAEKLKELAELQQQKIKTGIAAQEAQISEKGNKAKALNDDLDLAITHFNRLDELLEKYGTEHYFTNEKALLEKAYGDAIDAARLIGNTGVFNVGELPFLEKKLRDPTSVFNLSADAIRAQVKENIDSIKRKKAIIARSGKGFTGDEAVDRLLFGKQSDSDNELTGDPDVDQYLNQ